MLRSSDQMWSTHLLSPETEYLAVRKAKSISPSSTTTASGSSVRNSSSIWTRVSGVMVTVCADIPKLSLVELRGERCHREHNAV